MLYYVKGNIFESPAQTLVNTVNTRGAMGKGLAKEFKRLFPDMFKKYQVLCETGKFNIGKLDIYRTPGKWVLNFPTKEHWRFPSKIEYLKEGLEKFVKIYEPSRIESIAFPQLGCGNGELDWKNVKSLMEEYLEPLPIDIYIYEMIKNTLPEHKNIKQMREWLISEPASYPFDEFKRDLQKIVTNSAKLKDTAGAEFQAMNTKEGILISQNKSSFLIPWNGDETGIGWLGLWRLIRDKGMSTEQDISGLGIAMPKCIIGILLQLNYLQPLLMQDQQQHAVRLKLQIEEPPDLFRNDNMNANVLEL